VSPTETYRRVPDGWQSFVDQHHVGFGTPDLPPPVSNKLIGVYMSGNNNGLETYESSWPTKTNCNTYYVTWTGNSSSPNWTPPSHMSVAAGQGHTIMLEMDSKQATGGPWVTWANIASGSLDSFIIDFLDELDALGVPVYLSLENEADLKWDAGDGKVAPGQTTAQYKAACDKVYDLIHANTTNVHSLLWLAGGTASRAIAMLPTKSKLDAISWDPYKKGTECSLNTSQVLNRFIANVLIPTGYDTVPKRFITETGIKVNAFNGTQCGITQFPTSTQIDYYNGIPGAMDANDIDGVVWFRTNSGAHPYIPTDPAVDAAFRDMVDNTLGSGVPSFQPITSIASSTTSVADPDAGSGDPINEASGLIVSRKNSTTSNRIYWSFNDSGGTATLYAFDDVSPFTILGTYNLTGASNADWEDITQGPGPTPGVNYIYVGDMGSGNSGTREIYRIAEPTVTANQTPVTSSIACDTFTYTPPTTDAEALAMDPVTGDLFLFQKDTNSTRPRTASVWRCPASQLVAGGGAITWTQISIVRSIDASTNDGGITGADISADGSYIAICNYQEVWVWNRTPGQTVEQCLDANTIGPVYRFYPSGWGAESIAFDTQDKPGRIYTIAEGAGSSLKYVTVAY
jgi:hypothetical protein